MATEPMNDSPLDLGERGAELWKMYADNYELDASDYSLLLSACRCVDLIEELDAHTRQHGAIGLDGKAAPSVVESRFQKALMLKMLAQLTRLAQPVDGATRNLGGSRGIYAVGSK